MENTDTINSGLGKLGMTSTNNFSLWAYNAARIHVLGGTDAMGVEGNSYINGRLSIGTSLLGTALLEMTIPVGTPDGTKGIRMINDTNSFVIEAGNSENSRIGTSNTHSWQFISNGIARGILQANGEWGFGTILPDQTFHFQTQSTANYGAIFHNPLESDSNGAVLYIASENSAGTISNVSIESQSKAGVNSNMRFRTGGSGKSTPGILRFQIDENGNGIYADSGGAGEFRVGSNLVVGKITAAGTAVIPIEVEKSAMQGIHIYNPDNANGAENMYYAAQDNGAGTYSNVAFGIISVAGTSGDFEIRTNGTTPFVAGTRKFAVTSTGNIRLGGTAALATTATDGFPYIPTCAGVPTGVPTTITGSVAMVFDTTNNRLYIYDGAWLLAAFV
jgi:hypothetical protein